MTSFCCSSCQSACVKRATESMKDISAGEGSGAGSDEEAEVEGVPVDGVSAASGRGSAVGTVGTSSAVVCAGGVEGFVCGLRGGAAGAGAAVAEMSGLKR